MIRIGAFSGPVSRFRADAPQATRIFRSRHGQAINRDLTDILFAAWGSGDVR